MRVINLSMRFSRPRILLVIGITKRLNRQFDQLLNALIIRR